MSVNDAVIELMKAEVEKREKRIVDLEKENKELQLEIGKYKSTIKLLQIARDGASD